jgi:hypothetical protein
MALPPQAGHGSEEEFKAGKNGGWRMARVSLGHQVFVMRYVDVVAVQVTDPKEDDSPRFNSQTSTFTGKFLHPP